MLVSLLHSSEGHSLPALKSMMTSRDKIKGNNNNQRRQHFSGARPEQLQAAVAAVLFFKGEGKKERGRSNAIRFFDGKHCCGMNS